MSKKESLTELREDEILDPAGTYHERDKLIKKDNPHNPYLRSVKSVPPEKIANDISFWKSVFHILFLPFSK